MAREADGAAERSGGFRGFPIWLVLPNMHAGAHSATTLPCPPMCLCHDSLNGSHLHRTNLAPTSKPFAETFIEVENPLDIQLLSVKGSRAVNSSPPMYPPTSSG